MGGQAEGLAGSAQGGGTVSGMDARRAEEFLEAVFAEAEIGQDDVASVLSRLGDHAPGSGAGDFGSLAGDGARPGRGRPGDPDRGRGRPGPAA